jgi:hypothetical protein
MLQVCALCDIMISGMLLWHVRDAAACLLTPFAPSQPFCFRQLFGNIWKLYGVYNDSETGETNYYLGRRRYHHHRRDYLFIYFALGPCRAGTV